ncbi:hypothetical protein SAMN05444339_10257 [Loktanella atrilutea]|uniref:Uncharacterized protein n=2 Tax=Loktanella atrilutea TaxID=366533 RepID=A0A1M4WBI6_LOKAT|nr:hypothetical protein SAMN05444339_10257 [Loktanella atrilutea]
MTLDEMATFMGGLVRRCTNRKGDIADTVLTLNVEEAAMLSDCAEAMTVLDAYGAAAHVHREIEKKRQASARRKDAKGPAQIAGETAIGEKE